MPYPSVGVESLGPMMPKVRRGDVMVSRGTSMSPPLVSTDARVAYRKIRKVLKLQEDARVASRVKRSLKGAVAKAIKRVEDQAEQSMALIQAQTVESLEHLISCCDSLEEAREKLEILKEQVNARLYSGPTAN